MLLAWQTLATHTARLRVFGSVCVCGARGLWKKENPIGNTRCSNINLKKTMAKAPTTRFSPLCMHSAPAWMNGCVCVCECGTRKHGRLYVCPIIYNLYSQNVRCICDSGCWHTVLYILMLLFSVVFVYIPRSARFYFVQSKVDVQTVRTDHTPSASFRRMKTFPHTHKHSHTLQTFLLLLQINSIRFARSF